MRLILKLNSLFFVVLALVCAVAPAQAKPVPIDYFAVRNSISGVQVSPNGKYMAFMQISSKKGNPVLVVYETDNLKKKPFRADGGKLEIVGFNWMGDQDLLVSFRGRVRKKIKGFNRGVFAYRLAKLDMKSKKFHQFNEFGMRVVRELPNEPNKVLISYREGVKDGRVAEGQAVRALSYHKLNLKTGKRQMVLKGNEKYEDITFDEKGRPRFSYTFDVGRKGWSTVYRKPTDKKWKEIYFQDENDFEDFQPVGLIKNDPSRLYVIANNGNDKTGLWIYNVDSKQFEKLVFRRDDADVRGVRRHSNSWTHPDEIMGVAYDTDKRHIQFFDTPEAQLEAATMHQLEGMIPDAYDTRIVTRSRKGDVFVVVNTGPHDSGSYYLYNKGHFNKIGTRKALLKSKDLADVKFIKYKARDGRTIPAWVTVPHGKGPFPLVILPHGGPFVHMYISFDEWGQLLANNGYMVLQAQYRGSKGWGLDHYKSAFIPKGQGGYAMQDDLDDGAKYLVDKGWVDPNRIAMFGWSYGGYASLVAASRTPQINQCVVAGAAVADTNQQVNYYRFHTRGTQKIEQLNMWDDSISPIKEVAKVNVPMLIIHGDSDQRVPFKHFKKYTAALDREHKPYQALVLKGADHFGNTLTYDHKKLFYSKLLDFLKNDCGPGGL